MFGDLIIWYLFLGGVGAGAYGSLYAMGRCFRRRSPRWVRAFDQIRLPVTASSAVALGAGMVCLLADLANPSLAHVLLIKPTLSPISVGTFALVALFAGVLALSVFYAREATLSPQHVRVLRLLEGTSAVLSLVVAVYTGVLLWLMPSVPLWNTPLLPVLFALSSFSTGLAVIMLASLVAFWDMPQEAAPLAVAVRSDTFVVLLELLTAILMAVTLWGTEAARVAMEGLATGWLAPLFWGGFVGAGLVVPPVLGLMFRWESSKTLAPYAIIGICILIGGFALRYCMINGGVHLSAFMFAGS